MTDSYSSPKLRWVLVLILLSGAGLRLAYVTRPLDHRLVSPWRQSDYVQIARNFWREDPNLFYPRIDWRGETPGYVESELPLIPWIGARLFDWFGFHVPLLRGLSSLLGIASLLLFSRLARRLLPPSGVLLATAAFALNPLLYHLATAMQPEPLMVFGSVLAVLLLLRWEERPGFGRLLGAAAAAALAILAKAPAAGLGLVFAFVIWRRLGWTMLRSARVLAAGALAIGPPVAWYLWARHFYIVYGNSLGVSNGNHVPTAAMLFPPTFLIGILKWETFGVFSLTGWLLAVAALWAPRDQRDLPLVWCLSGWILYIAAAQTTAADWAFYYHSLTAAPGCLLMGAGLAALLDGRVMASRLERWRRLRTFTALLLATGTLVSLAAFIVVFTRHRDGRQDLLGLRTCALALAPRVPEDALIVTQGDTRYDARGRTGAFNIPMVFAWMDRKGFNYGSDELSIATLDGLAARGGRFWFAYGSDFQSPGFRAEVEHRYDLVARCQGDYSLYDLQRPPAATP